MAGRLSSKVVIVTGGSTGIGRAVAGRAVAGRVATTAGIASYVAYLLSDEAAFITGAALAIDGGATA